MEDPVLPEAVGAFYPCNGCAARADYAEECITGGRNHVS